MKKYIKILKTSMVCEMEYRFNFFSSVVFSMIPFATNVMLWIAIYSTGDGTFDMSMQQMITYFFSAFVIENLVNNNALHSIGIEIRNGDINKYLIKPCNYRKYVFCKVLAHNLLFCAVGIIPIMCTGLLLRRYLSFDVSVLQIFFAFFAVILAYVINFELNFILSLLAFYLSEVTSLFVAIDVLKGLATGKVIPLRYFPSVISTTLICTPLQYVCYFPLMILVGNYSSIDIVQKFIIGIFWLLVLRISSNLLWNKGLKRYSAFGG